MNTYIFPNKFKMIYEPVVCLVGEDLPNLKSVQRVCEYRR